jgi:hypothetical protein
MLPFAEAFLAWLAGTIGPAFAGMLILILAGRLLSTRYLLAFGLGIFLWFFVDTIQGSGDLEVNAGFTGGVVQVSLILLFVAGILVFFSFEQKIAPLNAEVGGSLVVPLLVATALGIHGIGEGAAFGATAAGTPSTSLFDAFGGLTSGVAYALHKALEPMMIGACYLAYSRVRASRGVGTLRDVALLTLAFTTPSLIGAATGYFAPYPVSFFFALGTGASTYALTKLARPFLSAQEAMSSSYNSFSLALAMAGGFLAIYVAALLHA